MCERSYLPVVLCNTAECLRYIHLQPRPPGGAQHERALLHRDFRLRQHAALCAVPAADVSARLSFMCCCASPLSVRSLSTCRRDRWMMLSTAAHWFTRFLSAQARRSNLRADSSHGKRLLFVSCCAALLSAGVLFTCRGTFIACRCARRCNPSSHLLLSSALDLPQSSVQLRSTARRQSLCCTRLCGHALDSSAAALSRK